MKKNYFLLSLVFFFSFYLGNAQLLTEDFSSGVPANGWTIDAQAGNWSQRGTTNAGGTAPEARMSWTPQFNGTTRLISPSVDLTGVNNVMISFKHAIDHYGGAYTVGVATRHAGGAWTSVWSMNGANIQEEKLLLVNNADTNQADFQFCLYFSGSSYNINYWYIDDIALNAAEQTDLAVNSVNGDDFFAQGNTSISCTVANMGVNPITSFDVTYDIDGTNAVTENVNGVNITSTNSYNYTFSTPWNAPSGNHDINIFVSNINGAGDDDQTANNNISKTVGVAIQTEANFPLFEEFTSSTCAPCASFNGSAMNPFMNNHPNDVAVVKYQMNWPGSGDPYYTAEGGVRRGYYAVSGVPSLHIGGNQYSTSSGGLNSGLTNENNKPGFFNIDAYYTIDGNTINVYETIMPYVNGNFKVHTAVVEKVTTGNVATNGETQFEHVMMKMLPDANGTGFNFGANQAFQQSFSYDMSSTNVEEMDDLAVVIFVQDDGSKKIMQAKYLPTKTPLSVNDTVFENVSLYPNPTKGILNITTNQEISVSVMDLLGKTVIASTKFNSNATLDLSNLNNGVYLVKVNNGNTVGTKKIILNK